jgi:hypothetical protein
MSSKLCVVQSTTKNRICELFLTAVVVVVVVVVVVCVVHELGVVPRSAHLNGSDAR